MSGKSALNLNYGPVTLKKNIIDGHHFWRETDRYQFKYFCSNEFHDRYKEEGFDGLTFVIKCQISD